MVVFKQANEGDSRISDEMLTLKRHAMALEESVKKLRKEERRLKREAVPYEIRSRYPAGNRSCYVTPEEQAQAIRRAEGEGMHVWQEWAQWYCRSVPMDSPHKNMTHELFLQLKCIQQGLDAIKVPSYVSGGAMIGLLTVGGMNIYEVDNDVVVPSSFDFEELQDYWSDLPENDICRDMILWRQEDVNAYRACFGIRDREKHCESKTDECSQIYRPYSDIIYRDYS